MAQARPCSCPPARARCFSRRSMRSSPASGRPSRCCACGRRRSPRAARRFVGGFPGDVLYAVKCNPEPRVLRALWAGGVRHFDCASLAEVALVRRLLPAAEMHFMHPVKSRAGDPRRLPRLRRDRFRVRQRRRAGEDPAGDGAGRAGRRRRRCWGCSCGSRCRRAARLRPVGQVRRRRSTRRPSCCARPGRTPPGSASPFMSARNASSRMPMRGRWRWPARRSRCPGSRSTSSMSAAASRSAIPIWCRRRSATTSPRSRRGRRRAFRRRRAAVGRARPRAGRGRRVGRRAGAAAARRRALRQ